MRMLLKFYCLYIISTVAKVTILSLGAIYITIVLKMYRIYVLTFSAISHASYMNLEKFAVRSQKLLSYTQKRNIFQLKFLSPKRDNV